MSNDSSNDFSLNELKRLGDLCGGMVHEVNNPLTVVTGQLSLLKLFYQKGEVPSEKALVKLEKIEQSLEKVNTLLGNMRKLPRSTCERARKNYLVKDFLEGLEVLCGYPLKKQDIYIQNIIDKEDLKINIYWEEVFCLFANIYQFIRYCNDDSKKEDRFIKVQVELSNDKVILTLSTSELLPQIEFFNEYQQILKDSDVLFDSRFKNV